MSIFLTADMLLIVRFSATEIFTLNDLMLDKKKQLQEYLLIVFMRHRCFLLTAIMLFSAINCADIQEKCFRYA